MRIAFTAGGTDWDSKMDPRFGRTEYILLFEDETEEFTHYDNRAIAQTAHGAGPQTAQKLLELKPDILITGNGPGGNAGAVFKNTSLKIYIGAGDMTVKEAFKAYQKGALTAL